MTMKTTKTSIRQMTHEKSAHRVRLISKSVEEGKKNAFRVEFSTNGFPNVRTSYMSGGDGTDYLVSSFRTGILRVSEYNETIPPDKSTNTLQLVGKKDVTWSDIEIDEHYNGTNATRAVTFGAGNGHFHNFSITIEVFSTPGHTILGQKNIQANDTKISLTIRGFPYLYDQGKVAIQFGIWSRNKRESKGNEVVTDGNVFTWDDTVNADGNISTITKLNVESSMKLDDVEDDQAEISESHDFVTFG